MRAEDYSSIILCDGFILGAFLNNFSPKYLCWFSLNEQTSLFNEITIQMAVFIFVTNVIEKGLAQDLCLIDLHDYSVHFFFR
jgi:hypothetical protein